MIPDKAFFVNPLNISLDHFQLDEKESKHAIKVLRLVKDDNVFLLDGIGCAYIAKIKNINSKKVSGKILEKLSEYGENKVSLKLASAIIKGDRFKTVIEKGTELGVQEFYPLVLDRCIKRKINYSRIKKNIISSSKQSRRCVFPILNESLDLEDFLNKTKNVIIAGVMNSKTKLENINIKNPKSISIIIGPEGDFSNSEMNLMRKYKVLFYNMGQRRLRAETAAIYSLCILNEKFN